MIQPDLGGCDYCSVFQMRVLQMKLNQLYQEGKQHFKPPHQREISVMFFFFSLPRWAVVRTSRRLNPFCFIKKKKALFFFLLVLANFSGIIRKGPELTAQCLHHICLCKPRRWMFVQACVTLFLGGRGEVYPIWTLVGAVTEHPIEQRVTQQPQQCFVLFFSWGLFCFVFHSPWRGGI